MKLIKTNGIVAMALGLVALGAVEAAAQAPTLSVSVNGVSVRIEWTSVLGATGYNIEVGSSPGGSNIASVNLPASITVIVVNAPSGTYYLRVRGMAGGLVGPFSNEAVAVVGGQPPGPCVPPTAPNLTINVQGPTVTVGWSPIAGAAGYLIQFSRFAGGTELQQTVGPGTTSYQQYVGMLGTFYVRVVAGNACGSATSSEMPFTITTTTGGGPRTPDPPPGQLLPAPGYGPAVVDDVARRFPGDLANACGSRTWLFRVIHELRRRDSRWGANLKRGHQGLSTDIVAYNPTNLPDQGNGQVYIFDIISAICEGNFPTWQDVTAHTWAARGDPLCAPGTYCVKWTLEEYLAAGFPFSP